MLLQSRIGILPVLVINVDFQIRIQTFKVGHFHRKTGHLIRRRQAVVYREHALVGRILYVAWRPRCGQEDNFTLKVVLPIRSHFYQVVVGQDQFNLHALNFARIGPRIGAILQIVAQRDRLAAVGRQIATSLEAALYERAKANLGAARLLAFRIPNNDVVRKERAAGLAVFGRIVANYDLYQRHLSYVLLTRQITLQHVAIKHFCLRLCVVCVDKRSAHFYKVAHLHFYASAEQAGVVRGLRPTGIAYTRQQHRGRILIRLKVPLNAVKTRL